MLKEILLRGVGNTQDMPANAQTPEKLELSKPLKALDLCGCVSRTFVEALEKLMSSTKMGDTYSLDKTRFAHMERLGLFNVLVSSQLLTTFVSAYPNLTHLDLSNTRATPALLNILGRSTTLKLRALSLSRCQQLDSQSLCDFFIESEQNVLADLTDLNLYFDATSAMPLTRDHLRTILEKSQVFRSGNLRYLDIATSPMDDELLSSCFPQPCLLDLGMSNCPLVSWQGVQRFLENKAPNVEVLDIRGSCRQPLIPSVGRTARRNDALLNTIIGIHQYLIPRDTLQSISNLRVIELEEKALEAIEQSGAHPDWRVFYGKGYRGWYVNCAVRPPIGTAAIERRPLIRLDKNDPARLRMIELARKSKSGGYNFGWHARKMTILRPDGMRECFFLKFGRHS